MRCASCSSNSISKDGGLCAHCDRSYCSRSCADHDWYMQGHYAAHIQVKRGRIEPDYDEATATSRLAERLHKNIHNGVFYNSQFSVSISITGQGYAFFIEIADEEKLSEIQQILSAERNLFDRVYVDENDKEVTAYFVNSEEDPSYHQIWRILNLLWKQTGLRWEGNAMKYDLKDGDEDGEENI